MNLIQAFKMTYKKIFSARKAKKEVAKLENPYINYYE